MPLWIIEPRDPLIVRDGRPFGSDSNARAVTLPFPYPSTLVGALRTRAGLGANGLFDGKSIDRVKQYVLHGPLLVHLNEDGSIAEWLLPAPSDALLLDPAPEEAQKDCIYRYSMAPQASSDEGDEPAQVYTNIPDGLRPIAPLTTHREKVSKRAPRFWRGEHVLGWLRDPQDGPVEVQELGIKGLELNMRVHVSIQPDAQTASEGALFQTIGLEFTHGAGGSWAQPKRLALAAHFSGAMPHFDGGLAPLGGERRLMHWRQMPNDLSPFTDADREGIFAQIIKTRRCRVVLLTPAWFKDGFRPPLQWERDSVHAQVKGACVPRMQVISGWDMAARSPKRTSALAPAGSTYFVEFPKQLSDADVRRWLDATWMKNVSDEQKQNASDDWQWALDGFGLAVLGVWKEDHNGATAL